MQVAPKEAESRYAWLAGRQRLASLIVQFNVMKASSVHPERASQWIDSTIVGNSQPTKRANNRLSEALRRWARLDENGYYEFKPLWRRFALLEYSSLQRLALLTGAALLRRQLSRIVMAEERQSVRAKLGHEAFDFAVKEASLIAGEHAYQESLSLITAESVEKVGWNQLEYCFSNESQSLIRRLELRLPVSHNLNFQRKGNSDIKQSVAHPLRKVLVKKVEPELAPCFQ